MLSDSVNPRDALLVDAWMAAEEHERLHEEVFVGVKGLPHRWKTRSRINIQAARAVDREFRYIGKIDFPIFLDFCIF